MEHMVNYVVARLWSSADNHLCAYAMGSQVLYGTAEEAKELAARLSKREDKEYRAYAISEVPL